MIVEAPRGRPSSGVDPGRDDAGRVEARVDPEVLVLDRGRRVEDLAGQVVERDELALEVAEAGQLDLAGPVVDDRLLLEVDVGQRRDRVGQALGVVVVGAHGQDRPGTGERAEGQDEHHEDDEERSDRRSFRPVLAVGAGAPAGGAGASRGLVCICGRTIA